jgi:hypothetical protein
MSNVQVSTFLLERYHIGEVTPEEKSLVENALAQDAALAAALANLDRADRDFWQRFPHVTHNVIRARPLGRRRLRRPPPLVWGICAAAVVLIIALPLFILKNTSYATFGDRMKGTSAGENSAELSVYLKGNSTGGEIKLSDQAGIQTGNTIQLAYRVQTDDSGERYGVIFSIDGRSSVTLHYPYNPGQSTQLVAGKAVPLDEAYTLDDAPGYEIFFFVVGDKPLPVKNVLDTARRLALQIAGQPQEALRRGTAAFKGYELTVMTLRKE